MERWHAKCSNIYQTMEIASFGEATRSYEKTTTKVEIAVGAIMEQCVRMGLSIQQTSHHTLGAKIENFYTKLSTKELV